MGRRVRTTTLVLALFVVTAAVGPAAVAGQTDGTPTDAQECRFPVTETDATGAEVTVEAEPETVVTLNPSAAQTMWEIGAEEKVIGVTKHATNLEGADERTNISRDGETIDPEIVVELEPDLVLAPSSQVVSEELVEVLREAGLTVYHYQSATSIEDVQDHTRLTGRFVGECEGAEETVAWMDHEIETVEAAVESEDRPLVLYTFFGFTAGEETFIHELLETAGGTNLAAEVGIEEYQQVNEETVIEQDPEWIVLNSDSPEVPDGEAYNATTAVREDQVVVVDINHLNRPGPRIVHGIAAMAEAFHPEAYASAAEAETNATGTAAAGSTDDAGPLDQPGFGAAPALLALLLAVLAARRTEGAP